jgi:hypothetical protein
MVETMGAAAKMARRKRKRGRAAKDGLEGCAEYKRKGLSPSLHSPRHLVVDTSDDKHALGHGRWDDALHK